MFDGNRFLPETGTPMRKIDRMRTLFAVCEPDPLAVATCSEKSLTTASPDAPARERVSVRTLDIRLFPSGPRTFVTLAGRGKMRRDLNSARAPMEESERAHRLAMPVDHGKPRRDGPRGRPRRRDALLHSSEGGARGNPARGRYEGPRHRGDSRGKARSRLLQWGGKQGGRYRSAEERVPGGRHASADRCRNPRAAAAFRKIDGEGRRVGEDFFEGGRGFGARRVTLGLSLCVSHLERPVDDRRPANVHRRPAPPRGGLSFIQRKNILRIRLSDFLRIRNHYLFPRRPDSAGRAISFPRA